MNSLTSVPNTFIPQAPLGYTDKTHANVYLLSLNDRQSAGIRVLKAANAAIENRIKPQFSLAAGVTSLTFEDTLSVAYIEGKAFQDSPSLLEGLHNMENGLIAKDINNTAKGRPNLSLKYADSEGKMKGYLLAYQGTQHYDGKDWPIIFISDFSIDRPLTAKGNPGAGLAGGKLILEFSKLYKENYLDKGNMTPIYTNARDQTSYRLLTNQLKSLGHKLGYRFEIRELSTDKVDSSTMHNVLIIPHQILPEQKR